MITIDLERQKDGEVYKSQKVCSPWDALSQLLECDIGWNSEITELTGTILSNKAKVLGCIDLTTYKGSEDDMKYLVKAASYAMLLQAKQLEPEYREALVNKVAKLSEGSPRIIDMGLPMFLGSGVKRGAILGILGEGNEQDLDKLKLLDYSGLTTLLNWKVEGADHETLMSTIA